MMEVVMMQHKKAICDTVSLKLPIEDFKIDSPSMFTPNANEILHYKGGTAEARQNPTSEDKRLKIYKPALTLRRDPRLGGMETYLYIEFSAPKLIFGNNLQEVSDNDFPTVVETLVEKLSDMGVVTTKEAIVNAHVSKIHYCKNIFVEGKASCQLILSDIAKADITKRLDCGKTDYRNDGHCVRYHTNTYEIALYDKLLDVKQAQKSGKKSVEPRSHRGYQNFSLETLGNTQILRIENRLNGAKIIRSIMERAKIEIADVRFNELFNSSIAQQINSYFWSKIHEGCYAILNLTDDPMELATKLKDSYKPPRVCQLLGVRSLICSVGIRATKKVFGNNLTVSKIINEWENYQPDLEWKHKLFNHIKKEISRNEVIKLPQ